MIEDDVKALLAGEPSQPFRIKPVNGDGHDVPDPATVAVLEQGLYIASQDGHWVQFHFDRITSGIAGATRAVSFSKLR